MNDDINSLNSIADNEELNHKTDEYLSTSRDDSNQQEIAFVHLRIHSEYSLYDSTLTIKKLIERTKKRKYASGGIN